MNFLSLLKIRRTFITALIILSIISTQADEAQKIISQSEALSAQVSKEASELMDSLRDQSPGKASPGKVKPSSLASGQKLAPPKPQKDIPLAHEGKKKCGNSSLSGKGKCPTTLFETLQNMEDKPQLYPAATPELLIFVSQSMPESSIQDLYQQAQKGGGKLVFRGLIGGSFKETQRFIQELGIIADIDPPKFEEYEVKVVPTFVLSQGRQYDKAAGNISLSEFLEQASQIGDLKAEATVLLKRIQGIYS